MTYYTCDNAAAVGMFGTLHEALRSRFSSESRITMYLVDPVLLLCFCRSFHGTTAVTVCTTAVTVCMIGHKVVGKVVARSPPTCM